MSGFLFNARLVRFLLSVVTAVNCLRRWVITWRLKIHGNLEHFANSLEELILVCFGVTEISRFEKSVDVLSVLLNKIVLINSRGKLFHKKKLPAK
jgi:hypothetical protein